MPTEKPSGTLVVPLFGVLHPQQSHQAPGNHPDLSQIPTDLSSRVERRNPWSPLKLSCFPLLAVLFAVVATQAYAGKRILVLCTGNSARSQMAEGILRSLDSGLEVFSAGTQPAARVNPYAIRVMQEIGLDISQGKPKSVSQFVSQSFDYVITVCDDADKNCPVFTGKVGKRSILDSPIQPGPRAAKNMSFRFSAGARSNQDQV